VTGIVNVEKRLWKSYCGKVTVEKLMWKCDVGKLMWKSDLKVNVEK
jgi:hypothetical protein